MITFYLKVSAEIDTLAHAQTIATWLETQLSGLSTHRAPRVVWGRAGDYAGRPPYVALSVWFEDQASRDALRDAIRDQLGTTRRAWIVRAVVTHTRCTHFEPTVTSCDNIHRVNWSPA